MCFVTAFHPFYSVDANPVLEYVADWNVERAGPRLASIGVHQSPFSTIPRPTLEFIPVLFNDSGLRG